MTDPKQTVEHQWCDAWLLMAVALASGEGLASLRDIVAAADAIQHAIPEFHEVDGGLARLTAAGLLDRGPGGFALTRQGAVLTAETKSGGWLQHQEAIERALEASRWSAAYLPANAGRGSLRPVVTEDEYRSAVKTYSRGLGAGGRLTRACSRRAGRPRAPLGH